MVIINGNRRVFAALERNPERHPMPLIICHGAEAFEEITGLKIDLYVRPIFKVDSVTGHVDASYHVRRTERPSLVDDPAYRKRWEPR